MIMTPQRHGSARHGLVDATKASAGTNAMIPMYFPEAATPAATPKNESAIMPRLPELAVLYINAAKRVSAIPNTSAVLLFI